MTTLTRFSLSGARLSAFTEEQEISEYLNGRGVRFEVWPVSQTLQETSEPEVEDAQPTFTVEDQVRRLDIAVNDAL